MIDTKELRNDAKTAHYGHLPLEVSGSELLELLDRLEAAEKERDAARDLADRLALALNTSNHERDNLRAKIAEMEQQGPVWFIDERGEPKRYHKSKADYCKYGGLDLLYALPGAKGEEK